MSQDYQAGDFLIFQIESGYGLLRLLEIENRDGREVWHLRAYREMFPDIDMAEDAINEASGFTVSQPHMALTTRAFESTQTARMANLPLLPEETAALENWKQDADPIISDRSVRLLLGLR